MASPRQGAGATLATSTTGGQGVKITIKLGERTISVRDDRPVLDPPVLAELLAALGEHLMDFDAKTALVSLPFGFTKIADQDDGDDEEDEPPASGRSPFAMK